MEHSVKLTLSKDDSIHDNFYHAYEEGNEFYVLDLCQKLMTQLWPQIADQKNIVVKVSERKHEGSRKISAKVDSFDVLRWSAAGDSDQRLDSLAGNWLLKRFSFFANREIHTIYVSAKPLPD
jgi:hypothetical protein